MKDDYESRQLKSRKLQIKYGQMKYTLPHLYKKKNAVYTKFFNAGKNFRVGYNTFIYKTHRLDGIIYIGNNVRISDHCIIDYSGKLFLDDNVMISEGVKIYSHKHAYYGILGDSSNKAIPVTTKICKDVTIDAGCIIYPGVTIGEHAVIYAGSVVMNDVEAYGIVAGNPARDVREVLVRRKSKKKDKSIEVT